MARQRSIRRFWFCIAISTGLLPTGARPQEPVSNISYSVTDLGMLADCDVTYAQSVNDAGSVVGYAYPHTSSGHGNEVLSRSYLWRGGTLTALPAIGGEHGQALAINARGDVAGYAQTGDYVEKPVLWPSAQHFVPTRLSELPGRATCLLDDGTAGGFVFHNERDTAAVWKNGTMQMLSNPRDAESACSGVNSKGIAVGWFVPAGGQKQSIWSPGDRHAAMWKEKQQIALPESGGALSECKAINEAGIAVGWSGKAGRRSACMWKEGKFEALPAPAGFDAKAHAINYSGVIVGDIQERANKEGWKWLACIWRGGRQEDLNDLIPGNSGWTLSVAAHISDKGLIVGYGHYNKFPNHAWRAFLLTPAQP